jgi:hypothetical protein
VIGERGERPTDDGVLREPLDAELTAWSEGDAVAEVDSLQDRDDLVLAVCPSRPDDVRQVDLGWCRCAPQRRAAVSVTNSAGASASARAPGGRP